MSIPEVYRSPDSMEPLMPKGGDPRLAELTCEILKASGCLTAHVHAPRVLEALAAIIREMNCYYSNLIEGHKTTPCDIERAMGKDFSKDPTQRDNQLLGLAHIEVEKQMVARLAQGTPDVCSADFICWLHGEFYRHLPDSLHWAKTAAGKRYRIVPGAFRDFMVDVGHHTPPHFDALPAFLARFREFYGGGGILETDRLVAIASAHHRLAWIHPFGDGNGRVTRLHSHALMIRCGIDGHGLWTLSRGLARHRDRYYRFLDEADQRRRNDFDGRGNLSHLGLTAFCTFFLEIMLDQIQFMSGLLELPALRTRVERYFQFEALHITRHREALMRVVRTLVDEGEITRARVQEINGKGATISAEIIREGLADGLFTSPSPKGPLHVAFPDKVRGSYFPQLFLDLPDLSAEADAEPGGDTSPRSGSSRGLSA